MTAIRPAKLKHESSQLANKFLLPEVFMRELHTLLDRYADRTHRTGLTSEPTSILPSYNVPPQVMRQIARDLKPLVNNNPNETLVLCDKLWSQAYFELRYLAAFLLGQISPNPPDQIINHLIEWSSEALDELMVDSLLEYGLTRLRSESHKVIYTLSQTWLNSGDKQRTQMGIKVLIPLIDHPSSEDIPTIFRLTTPLIRQASIDIQPDILFLWRRLAQSIPHETAYHLRQNLIAPDNPDTNWFVRRLISDFPSEIQKSLRKALREKEAA